MPRAAPSRSPPHHQMPTGWVGWPPDHRSWAAGAGGDLVDERRPLRPGPARAGRLAGRITDADKVKGLAPLAGTTDRIDAGVPPRAVPPRPGPEIWLPPRGPGRAGTGPMAAPPSLPPDRAQAPPPRHLVALATPCPVSDLLWRWRPSAAGPPGLPEPWIGNLTAAWPHRRLDDQIDGCDRQLRHLGADHPMCRCC